MYAVSQSWISAQNQFLAPEGLVEISCYIPALKTTLVYTKRDLISFVHQQTGSLVSGELPKNHIEFSLDNSDGKWNPNNPRGLERYLSERLRIKMRYGYRINGVEQWIPGGVFYLSEWHSSPNGMEATFVARDILEYMIDRPYTGEISGTLYEIASRAIAEAGVAEAAVVGEIVLGQTRLGVAHLSDKLKNYRVGDIEYEGNETVATVLQKCANAAGCVMYQNRNGVLVIDELAYEHTGYIVPKRISYAYPEVVFSRPMKDVSVTYYGSETTVYPFSSSGETQTLNNEFILTKEQADAVAFWVCDSLRSRQQISGEFRGDPRFDLFDVIDVEGKYGAIAGVVLTNVRYSYNGAFRMSYSGYVRGSGVSVSVYCGEIFTGEVV